jgi:hypothetical protein
MRVSQPIVLTLPSLTVPLQNRFQNHKSLLIICFLAIDAMTHAEALEKGNKLCVLNILNISQQPVYLFQDLSASALQDFGMFVRVKRLRARLLLRETYIGFINF